jgi:hypothetical protein
VRLKAMLPMWMPWIRKRLGMGSETERELLTISLRQMDRRLRDKKLQACRKLYGRTKPGLLLKHQIAVKTESWDVRSPGFTEIDLVSHSGNSGAGEFGHTLNVTDIHSTWVLAHSEIGNRYVLTNFVWDGGNNDTSFYKPEVTITVADPLVKTLSVLIPGVDNPRSLANGDGRALEVEAE